MRYHPIAGLLLAILLAAGLDSLSAAPSGVGVVAKIDGPIGPATAAFVDEALAEAQARNAGILILQMDTPGGLDAAMRSIIKAIQASPIPVVSYVAPTGARAASAGTYILYASHVAAMAPGTNLGAATPVQIGGLGGGEAPESPDSDDDAEDGEESTSGSAMSKKLVNDAAAYIRSLANLRGRNADWGEQAVREGASLPAEEAVEKNVVDLLARDLDALLAGLDGRTVQVGDAEVTLETIGLTLTEIEPNWKLELLAILSNPNVAYVLLLIGIYGLIYEFSNPGAVFPGTVGAVSLLLALYALQLLPVNYAGIALILLGLGLMMAEAFVPSFGAFGVGGIAAFVIGSLILIDTDVPGFGLSVPLVLALTMTSALLVLVVVTMAIRSFRHPIVSGSEELIGACGHAGPAFSGEGRVHVRGEDWTARSARPIEANQAVRVVGRDGLTLIVEPQDSSSGNLSKES